MKRNSQYIRLEEEAARAKDAALSLASLSTDHKNTFLARLAEVLKSRKEEILAANQKDLTRSAEEGATSAFLDRLALTPESIEKLAHSLSTVINLNDPVGEVLKEINRPNGLFIKKVRVPIGVIAIIYESRPDVTIEATSLCVKSGNAVILRGGRESYFSNRSLTSCIRTALEDTGISPHSVTMVSSRSRGAVRHLLSLTDSVDLVIPRGGESLIQTVVKLSRIPVIKHYKGVCHIFVDSSAVFEDAYAICLNAKIQRPATCNAMETLLVHASAAPRFLPEMARLFQEAGVQLRGCPISCGIVPSMQRADDSDWGAEYLDLILSVKVVSSVEEAISHINRYGTRHSDAIVTTDSSSAKKFLYEVDSACVYHNASTRFTDGGEFGFGAEIGISTDKIHARGPMALEELTTYKYLIYGNGQIRR